MKKVCLAAMIALLVGHPAIAAPPKSPVPPPQAAVPSFCKLADALIENDVKDLSDIKNDEMFENSAPRASVAEGKLAADYLEIQTNILLMEQHHCSPHAHPIDSSDYLLPSVQCKTARLKNGTMQSPECDRAKWVSIHEQAATSSN